MSEDAPEIVSVVVPCRNERRHMAVFLDSLSRQDTQGLECEFVVADGMSDDGTREILRQAAGKDTRIRMVDNPARLTSHGLNAAIRAARGGIVLRMDCHSYYAPDYIRSSVAVLRETGADNVGGAARARATRAFGHAVAAAYRSRFSTGGARFHDPDYEGFVDTVTYGCWRKETLLRLGLFDEELVRNQDDELNLRLVRAGGKIWQSRKIVSWYFVRASLVALFRQYFQYGFWKVVVIRKHRLPASWRHLVPGTFVLANLALLVSWCGTAAAGAGAPATGILALWGAMLGAYFFAVLLASLAARRDAGWKALPLLPLVFVTYHVSYGCGFLLGLLYWARRNPTQAMKSRALAGLSR